MDREIKAIINHFKFDKIPVEGTFYKSTYVSKKTYKKNPISTAIIGMYCQNPLSNSIFHRLSRDEVWHFYRGDPFNLYLLYPNGKFETIKMGNDILNQQHLQFVIPANVWQAGELIVGGKYALFGCTVSPGFTRDCFEGGTVANLSQQYPQANKIIKRLGLQEPETHLPGNYIR